jgi:hypothetical protein
MGERKMLPVREELQQKMLQQSAEKYYGSYRDQMDILEDSLLSKVRPITPFDVYALGKQLESWEVYRAMCEEDGTLSTLGTIPKIAFDVITVNYGTSPIAASCSIQPIDEQSGSIYYKKLIAETTRGNVQGPHWKDEEKTQWAEGDSFLDPRKAPDVVPFGYASGGINATLAIKTGTTDGVYEVKTDVPVVPGKVGLTADVIFDADRHVDCNGMDDGKRFIMGSNGMSGKIEYNATLADGVSKGIKLTLRFFDADGELPVGGTVTISAQGDWSAADDLPKIVMKFDSKPIDAVVYALKDTIGLEASYALRRRFGLIAEDEVASDLISAINSELMNTLVSKFQNLFPKRQPEEKDLSQDNATVIWYKEAPTGVSYYEHKQSLKDAMSEAEGKMITNAGRGTMSVMLAGTSACAILQTLPGWVKLSDGKTMGPHIFGTLDGVTVIRIPTAYQLGSHGNSGLDPDTIIGIYKGASPFEGAAVYAPYMPLVVTSALPTGANPLLNQKAAAVWAAIEVLVERFVVRIYIRNEQKKVK